MYNLLKNKNEGLKVDVVAFTQKLIRTPSPSLGESDAAKLVEDELRRIPCDKVFRDDVGNVIGLMLGREAEPTVLLNCHIWDRSYSQNYQRSPMEIPPLHETPPLQAESQAGHHKGPPRLHSDHSR